MTDADDTPPRSDDGVETPRRYWVGVVIVVLAILLVIGFALVTFVASDNSSSSTVESLGVEPGLGAIVPRG